MAKKTRSEDVKKGEIESLKKEYFKQIESHTSDEIKSRILFDLTNNSVFKFRIDKKVIETHKLDDWLANYKKEAMVSTGGIRGAQNILYPWDTRYPLNHLGVALATTGKVLVLKEDKENKKDTEDSEINKLCAGEVRFNTQDYIDIITRIQAANKIKTHLTLNKSHTSIWMSSFLIFMLDYDGGEYVTSSHAISSKIATKDLDNQGSQFVPEMSIRFVKKIEEILEKAKKSHFDIEFSAKDSKYLIEDFDGFDLYVDYLKKGVAAKANISLIQEQVKKGLKIMYETLGGSMFETMPPIFERLGIINVFDWNNSEPDPFFHGVGKVLQNPITKNKEFFDYGCDATMKEVIQTFCYEKLLKDKPEGYIVLIVDPDGDRLVVGQIESAKEKAKLNSLGVNYLDMGNNRVFSYFMPNQLFLLMMEFYSLTLKKAGIWDNHPRFIITTTPSAASWPEWAKKKGVNVAYVPVGFKQIANIMKKVEKEVIGKPRKEVIINDIFGTKINLGKEPRLLFAGEESGGMITGPENLIESNKGRKAIAMREKSAGEASVLMTSMAAQLFKDKKSISDYLKETFEKYKIIKRYDILKNIRFYNESNPDPVQLKKEKAEGEKQRDKTDNFFLSIALAVRLKKITMKQAKELLSDTLQDIDFSNLNNIHFVGDGTYFDFSDKFVEIRKSGTDAIIKCYSAGTDKKECIKYVETIAKYNGDITPKFEKTVPKDIFNNCQEIAQKILREFEKID